MVENEIITDFTSESPSSQVFMITGIRGGGKTVFLTSIAKQIGNLKDWIVLDLNSEREMLKQMAAQLYSRKDLLQIFKNAKLNLSFFGISLELDSEPSITDELVALEQMLQKITQQKKKDSCHDR